jgi:hypothetical protein
MFIHSLNQRDAFRKLDQIIGHFQRVYPDRGPVRMLMRTDRAITLILPWIESATPIQIVLRLYSHPAEILLGFDLPCVKVCFDGQNIWSVGDAEKSLE